MRSSLFAPGPNTASMPHMDTVFGVHAWHQIRPEPTRCLKPILDTNEKAKNAKCHFSKPPTQRTHRFLAGTRKYFFAA
jgi:hypothetical protein